MTRILVPVLIGIFVILAGMTLLPIFFREMLWRWRRERANDEWGADVEWYE